MCGICGFVNYRNDELLKKANHLLIHRGPDEEGYYFSDKVSLASRRLKIIDLEKGLQPIYNEDKTIVIVFNGEIYNFKEKKKFLESKGHIFYTNTDTEVLVHLYEEFGEKMFSHLRGMFAFALYDLKNDIFILARDHFGIKPVFYCMDDNKLFFASEIKALINSGLIISSIEPRAIDYYFTRLYIPAPQTIYKKIQKIKPAHYIIFKKGKWDIKQYWKIEEKKTVSQINDNLLEEIDFLISESVKEQMLSDVPLGLFLSGGIDSSTILYYLIKNSNKKIKTFTISYKDKNDFDESDKANIIANFFDTEHRNVIVKPDIENTVKLLARSFDQPFADSSAIPTYLISRQVKEHITVALTGIGGDEIFAGYPRYIGLRFLNYYLKLPLFLRKKLYKIFAKLHESHDSFNYLGRVKRFLKGGIESDLNKGYLSWISYLDQETKKDMYVSDFYAYLGNFHEEDFELDIYDNIFSFELKNYLEGDLLYLADMSSMINSLELRVPLLDIRLVELIAKIPLRLKLKKFKTKYILKKILKKKIPEEILKMPKHGFQLPLSLWFKGELKDFIFDIVNSSDGIYYKKDFVKDMFLKHVREEADYSDQIYSVLIFELWRKSINGN